jgi:hypothetical protein
LRYAEPRQSWNLKSVQPPLEAFPSRREQ